MESEILVSIITPCYNAVNYLERCLKSCINQTYKNIEIICINDGSTDGTLELLNKFSDIDNRIKIIDKFNEGVNDARKDGIKFSKGEFIVFLDSDDWIDESLIEKCLKKCIKYDLDILIFNYFYVKKEIIVKNKFPNIRNVQEDLLKSIFIGDINPSLWNKIYKKKFLEKKLIELPKNLNYAEDLAIIATLAMSKPKISYINEYLYYYVATEGSITNSINNKVLDVAKAVEIIKNELIENRLYEKYKEEFEFLSYMHNFRYRASDIFRYKSDYNKVLYNTWRVQGINIRKNKYYKKERYELGNIFLNLCEKNYKLGRILAKLV